MSRSALARRSPAYSHDRIYDFTFGYCDIKLLSVPRAKRVMKQWLMTLSYGETEDVINCIKISKLSAAAVLVVDHRSRGSCNLGYPVLLHKHSRGHTNTLHTNMHTLKIIYKVEL